MSTIEPETATLDPDISEAVESLLQKEEPNFWGPHSITYFGPGSRSIMITGDIDEKLAVAICSQIHELASQDPEQPITVHINTTGGSIIDGLAIYDTLLCVPCPIITLVSGGAFSCGLLLAMAGDIRLVTPNSMYFYHQPITVRVDVDSSASYQSGLGFYEWCKDKLSEIVRSRAGISKKKWRREFGDSTSKFFDASDAIKYGIATDILDFSVKPRMEIIIDDTDEEEE
jgi:ATP-dependent Clp protease protease subunit